MRLFNKRNNLENRKPTLTTKIEYLKFDDKNMEIRIDFDMENRIDLIREFVLDLVNRKVNLIRYNKSHIFLDEIIFSNDKVKLDLNILIDNKKIGKVLPHIYELNYLDEILKFEYIRTNSFTIIIKEGFENLFNLIKSNLIIIKENNLIICFGIENGSIKCLGFNVWENKKGIKRVA